MQQIAMGGVKLHCRKIEPRGAARAGGEGIAQPTKIVAA